MLLARRCQRQLQQACRQRRRRGAWGEVHAEKVSSGRKGRYVHGVWRGVAPGRVRGPSWLTPASQCCSRLQLAPAAGTSQLQACSCSWCQAGVKLTPAPHTHLASQSNLLQAKCRRAAGASASRTPCHRGRQPRTRFREPRPPQAPASGPNKPCPAAQPAGQAAAGGGSAGGRQAADTSCLHGLQS